MIPNLILLGLMEPRWTYRRGLLATWGLGREDVNDNVVGVAVADWISMLGA